MGEGRKDVRWETDPFWRFHVLLHAAEDAGHCQSSCLLGESLQVCPHKPRRSCCNFLQIKVAAQAELLGNHLL